MRLLIFFFVKWYPGSVCFDVRNYLWVLSNYELLRETRKRSHMFGITLLLTYIKIKLFWVCRAVANWRRNFDFGSSCQSEVGPPMLSGGHFSFSLFCNCVNPCNPPPLCPACWCCVNVSVLFGVLVSTRRPSPSTSGRLSHTWHRLSATIAAPCSTASHTRASNAQVRDCCCRSVCGNTSRATGCCEFYDETECREVDFINAA